MDKKKKNNQVGSSSDRSQHGNRKESRSQPALSQPQQSPRNQSQPSTKQNQPQPFKSNPNLTSARDQPQKTAWGPQAGHVESYINPKQQSPRDQPTPRQNQPCESRSQSEKKGAQQQSAWVQPQQSPRDQPTPRQNQPCESRSQSEKKGAQQQSAWVQPQQSARDQPTPRQNQPCESRSQPGKKGAQQQSAWVQPQQSARDQPTPRQNQPCESRSQSEKKGAQQQSAWVQPQQSPRDQPQPSTPSQKLASVLSQPQKQAWGAQSTDPSSSTSKLQTQHIEQTQQLSPDGQQSLPMGKNIRNKYPKQQSPSDQPQPSTSRSNQPCESRAQPEIKGTQEQFSLIQLQQTPRDQPQTSTTNPASAWNQPQKTSVQPQSSGDQQNVPTSKSVQSRELTSMHHRVENPISTPPQSTPSSARKSKGGFQPLEVVPGSCVGTRGQKLKIEANYLRIQLDRLVPKAYHYDIRFDPEKIPKKHLQDIVENFRTKYFPKYFIAYDGQNSVYSANPLPIPGNVLRDEMIWHDDQTNRDRTITITIKEVDSCAIDLGAIKKYVDKSPGIIKPLRAIQCLEIVLRMPFSRMFVNVNRSFFTRPNRTIDLGENYELWTGLYQSVVLGDVPLFNIDVVNKPFPSSRTVLNILTEVMNVNINQALHQPQQLDEYLKGLALVYKQPGTNFANVFKYNGLKDSSKTQTFTLENRKLTVEAYFREKNIPLRYPHLPCLWCGPAIKNIYLPLEFCSVQDGQVIRKKLSENQIRTVIAETATSTDVRKRRIMDLLDKIRHNESNVVKQFGISVGDKFTEVEARILPAPSLEYLSNPEVKVDRGVWNAEREKFLDGKQCTHWSVLKLDDRCPNSDIFKLADMISDIGRKANMSFAPKFTDLIEMRSNSRKHEIEQKMLILKRKNVELLFVIIPNRAEAYPNVKQAAELKCGILTQCIKSFTLARKLNGSTVYNILLKLNSKLNGLNHKVAVKHTPPIGRGKIMIVGADVTHPTGTMNEPSAVGVASSHDITALKYNMCWRIQNPTQEMITDLRNIMIEQLNYYKKCMNNELPDKILYYRDGVSDGQFEDILNIELAAIYTACQQMAPTYKPAVTFIVVQKRHNTRFYPGASRVSCGKNNNVMPGTIVDKFIIDPRQYQFFLVAHVAIQGVAKPTKYCVIWDDSNIKADELQALTFNLCHVFTRCNRAVSYVAPTYYAHLAAYRGKVYIQNERINMNNLELEFNQRQIREEISKGHPMFFV